MQVVLDAGETIEDMEIDVYVGAEKRIHYRVGQGMKARVKLMVEEVKEE